MNDNPILFQPDMVRALLEGRKVMTRRVTKPQPETRENESIQGHIGTFFHGWNLDHAAVSIDDILQYCPYGQPGERLWVKERVWLRPERSVHDMRNGADTWPQYLYFADDPKNKEWCKEHAWLHRVSIHCPRIASRLTLKIKNIRVERVQDITDHDAEWEGIDREWDGTALWYKNYAPGNPGFFKRDPVASFRSLWNSINAKPKPKKTKGVVTHYESYPWDEATRDPRETIRGVPHHCYPNPWIWVVEFEVIKQKITQYVLRDTELTGLVK